MRRGEVDPASGLYRATRRDRWWHVGGRDFRVVNLWRWWLIIRVERKGQLPV